jgi:hypothetical protein
MATKKIFISYTRGEPTTQIAEMLYKRIKVNLSAYGFAETFFDKRSIDAGDPFSEEIDQAMAQTTHFIALLSDDYWLSEQCQRELQDAVNRYEQSGLPKLLFVLTEKMDPNALLMAQDGKSAGLKTPFPKVQHLGQINFLGPYDQAGRLSKLKCNDEIALKDQLYDLIQDIKKIELS